MNVSSFRIKHLFQLIPLRQSLSAVALLGIALCCSSAYSQTTYLWNTGASGGSFDYFDGANWTPTGPATGAGNTADFNTLDLTASVTVQVNSPLTIGNMTFGDTNPAAGSVGTWELATTDPVTNILTLDNNGASPVLTVNPLEPDGSYDDVYLGNNIAGTNGFTKMGAGILTLGSDSSALTGTVFVKEGTLRIGDANVEGGAGGPNFGSAAPMVLSNGVMVDNRLPGTATYTNISLEAGATATLNATQNTVWANVTGLGSGETLNVTTPSSGRTITADGEWTGFDTVNFVNTAGSLSFVRARFLNGGGRPAWNPSSFTNTHVHLDNMEFGVQVFSSGNDVTIGELSGTSSASLRGSMTGSATRYILGGRDNDSEFAGTINGTGSLSIDKVGAGTLTLSGTFQNSMISGNTDQVRQGGVIRVSEGTLALANTANSIPGGTSDSFKTTIDVLAGATFDVSGVTDGVFTTSPYQKVQGVGTIVGAFNHAAGELRPADAASSTALTNAVVSNAGSMYFTGDLSFSGGNIIYDMNATGAGPNDLIEVTGTTDPSGGGTVTPNFLGADPAVGETYVVLTSSGGFTSSDLSGWTVNWFGRGTAPTLEISGNNLQFDTTALGTVGNIVWTGADSNLWDLQSATTDNWKFQSSGLATDFFQGDNVLFDDTGINEAVVLDPGMQPTDVTVNSNTVNYSFGTNGISASGNLIKQGTSTLTLSETNSFASAMLEQGTVDIGTATGALGANAIVMGAEGQGATLLTTAGSVTNNALVLAGGDNVLRSDNGTAFELPPLSGSGNLVIQSDDDALRLDINGVDDAFTGSVTFGADPDTGTASAMLVRFNAAGGDFPNATVVLVNGARIANQNGSSGIVDMQIGELQGEAGTYLSAFEGGGSSPGSNWIVGGLNTDSEFAGDVIDSDGGIASVTKVGTGTLTLSGNNTNTGTNNVNEGTLLINGDTSAATGGTIVNDGGTLGGTGIVGGNVLVNSGGSVAPGASAGTLTFAGDLDLTGLAGDNARGLVFELGASESDLISLSAGAVLAASNTLGVRDFKFVNLGDLVAGTYTLLETSSSLSGVLDGSDLFVDYPGLDATLSLADGDTDLVVTIANVVEITILPGDYNYDGMVDIADYAVWRNNLGAPDYSLGDNDTIGGVIGVAQYQLWKDHFGESLAGASSTLVAVPEPSTGLLVLLAAGLAVTLRGFKK